MRIWDRNKSDIQFLTGKAGKTVRVTSTRRGWTPTYLIFYKPTNLFFNKIGRSLLYYHRLKCQPLAPFLVKNSISLLWSHILIFYKDTELLKIMQENMQKNTHFFAYFLYQLLA